MCQWNCTGRPVISYLRMSSGLIFQRALSPMLRLHWRCYLPHTEQSLRIHVRLFSIDVLQMTAMETNDFRILIANFAILKLHRKLPQRLWALAVWLAQVQWSCVFCEFDDSPEFPRIDYLLQSNTQRPRYNRSLACSKLLHARRNGPTCWCLSEIVSTCFGWCGPSCPFLRHWVFGSQLMDLLEILAWCQSYSRTLRAVSAGFSIFTHAGFSKKNLTNSALDFELAVTTRWVLASACILL